MKLSSAKVQQTVSQFDAQAIPEDHPAVPQLNTIFGEHTFFVGPEGLSIVEPAEEAPKGAVAGQVIRLATWRDDSRTSLEPHPPEATDVVVILESEH